MAFFRPMHKRQIYVNRLSDLAAIIIGLVWGWSAYSKWGVAKAVDLYSVIRDVIPWIPHKMAETFSLYLPASELILALSILFPPTRRIASVLSILVLLCFIGFLMQAWTMGYENSCGCFGEVTRLEPGNARRVYGLAVLRNIGLISLCVLALVKKQRNSDGL